MYSKIKRCRMDIKHVQVGVGVHCEGSLITHLGRWGGRNTRRSKTKAFSLTHSPPRLSSSIQSRFIPKCVHETRSWHNRPASFVSGDYGDMVHHDLRLNNRCHKPSSVAGSVFEGCPIFSEVIVTQFNIAIPFACVFASLST